MKPITLQQALARAAALCSRSEHAPGDIATRLRSWGLTAAQANDVVNSLIEQNFINTERFARAFTHDKAAYNGWGRIKIAYHLRLKGIDQSAIDDALATIDDDAYRYTLSRLLQNKWREVSGREPQAARAALLRFATSRGFELDLVRGLCSTLFNLV